MLEEITVGNPEFSLWVCFWGLGSGVWTNGVFFGEQGEGSVELFLGKTPEKGGCPLINDDVDRVDL